MIEAQILIIILVLISAILGTALSLLLILHIRSMKHREILIESSLLREDMVKIIAAARAKAEELVGSVHLSTDQIRSSFEERLAKLSESQQQAFTQDTAGFLEVYKKDLAGVQEEQLRTMRMVLKSMEEAALTELRNFKTLVANETSAAQKVVEKKIEDDYIKLKGELETYRRAQMGQIDEKIYQLVAAVSKRVLGKAISLQEHQTLVMEALEDAKQQGLLHE